MGHRAFNELIFARAAFTTSPVAWYNEALYIRVQCSQAQKQHFTVFGAATGVFRGMNLMMPSLNHTSLAMSISGTQSPMVPNLNQLQNQTDLLLCMSMLRCI